MNWSLQEDTRQWESKSFAASPISVKPVYWINKVATIVSFNLQSKPEVENNVYVD